MAQACRTLGVDFGTSNSAAGYLLNGSPKLIEISDGAYTLPTTFFFDFDTQTTVIGEPANQALLNGDHGRFMRALKRVLGTSLMHEKRQILRERETFVDIIGRFLAHLKSRAEAEAGLTFDRALSGRPVVFHGPGHPREQQAEDDLRACYHAAGFSDVTFMAEPEAAAIASGALEQSGEIGLIVDIGGGTSDFSLFRSMSDGVQILANHGVRIGGTDFDRSVSIDHVMPLLGKGTALRDVMGKGTSKIPHVMFHKLATWEEIPFLYSTQSRRMAADMLRQAVEPDKLARLNSVLSDELGHDLAFAVERGKIAANSGSDAAAIDLGVLEPGLRSILSEDDLAFSLIPHSERLEVGVAETLKIAGIQAGDVSRVIYVGGSSLMSMVTDTLHDALPDAEHSFSEVFTAVTNGLAIAAGRGLHST